MATRQKDDDGIDYRPEGRDDGHPKKDSTDAGYDEAAHGGGSRYGVAEGEGGVFGTTGGGTYEGGMQIVEREIPYPSTEPEEENPSSPAKEPK